MPHPLPDPAALGSRPRGFTPAERVARLGTETVFAVSAEAAKLSALGRTIYPFHLGDLNIATARPIVEAMDAAVRDGKTTYCANAGIAPLREALAADVSAARGVTYGADDVSMQPGGKPVIGKFLLAAMNAGDEVLYPNPGFPIYSSFIEFLGGVAVPYGFVQDGDRYTLDLASLECAVTPRTRILILNDLHNPTAAECTPAELQRIADLAVEHDLLVLSDEAYFDVRFRGRSASIVSLPGMQERTVILYTFSKKYAMTGWRVGAAVGPAPVIDIITRLNVNVESCVNHFVQYGALAALTGDQGGPREMMARLERRRDAALRLLNATPGVACPTPEATFYLYPDVTEAVRRTGCAGHEDFRRLLLDRTGVSFCTRQHFGRALPGETRYHLRLAYSGVSTTQIEEGLGAMKAFLESAQS
jgi:aspartate/methionine/tyrosine aminotransferase